MYESGYFPSPMGNIRLTADDVGLTGLWFEGQKYSVPPSGDCREEKDLPIFEHVKSWLSLYFSGRIPEFFPPIHVCGSPFQMQVWNLLSQIPYGKIATYGEIARVIAERRGMASLSAQAVGGAVGHNPVSILIPCHRVIGKDGSLTGYAGGVERKQRLLALEHADFQHPFQNFQ